MIAVHQPTVYVASPQQTYYYVPTQTSVPAGQWTTTAVQVAHSGSGYVYGSYQTSPAVYTTQSHSQQQQQHGRPMSYAFASPQQQQQMVATTQMVKTGPNTATFAYAPTVQSSPSSSSVSTVPRQVVGPIPVPRSREFVPSSPVLSIATTSSDDSSGSYGSSTSSCSRYNLPPSAINHYTGPQRPRRRASFYQQSPRYDPYGAPPGSSPQQIEGLQRPGPTPIQYNPGSLSSQPAFVRTNSRSARPVSYHEDETGDVYSSFELYKPSSQRPEQIRPALSRRSSSSTNVAALGPGSYGSGLGMSTGPSMGYGMVGGGDDGRGRKWWKVGG